MDFTNNIISHIQIVILTSLIVLGTSFAFAEDPPIHVEADKMTSTEKNNSVVFTGEVDAKQGDIRIRSDVMTVYYTPKEKNSKKAKKKKGEKKATQQVEKLVCTGNVEITRAEWLGTSKKMVYLSRERQVILTGNAKAWTGKNLVSG
jgi:lipopolysaccharide export system protein LptA